MSTDTLKHIISEFSYNRNRWITEHPSLYQWVITGIQPGSDPNKRIGYCVQVRKRAGAYGTDMIFLRHCDGQLVVHENQSFYELHQNHIDLIKPHFVYKPEDEDVTQEYRCCNKIGETGFLIEKSSMPFKL
jgi:hypothetical protein